MEKTTHRTKIICFSGHRASKLCGWDVRKYERCQAQLLDLVSRLYDMGYETFITGGAQGFDQLVFWAVEELKETRPDAHNWLFGPFPGHESMWARTGLFSQADYTKMKVKADRYVLTKPEKPDTKDGVVRALSQRNTDMLRASDALCAFINPDELNNTQAHSGTKSCVNTAGRQGLKIITVPYAITNEGLMLK